MVHVSEVVEQYPTPGLTSQEGTCTRTKYNSKVSLNQVTWDWQLIVSSEFCLQKMFFFSLPKKGICVCTCADSLHPMSTYPGWGLWCLHTSAAQYSRPRPTPSQSSSPKWGCSFESKCHSPELTLSLERIPKQLRDTYTANNTTQFRPLHWLIHGERSTRCEPQYAVYLD